MEFLEYEGSVEGGEETGRVEGGAQPLPHALGSSAPPRGGASGGPGFAGDAGAQDGPPLTVPRLVGGRRTARVPRTVKASEVPRAPLTPEQRLLMLDTWKRSGLAATEFSVLVGISPHTLYEWKRRFETRGPAGLADRRTGKNKGSRLAEPIRRAIRMMKEAHPDWGQERLHDMLLRAEGFAVSPGAIATVLAEAGYVVEAPPQRPNEPAVRTFERAHPNDLWQTDLFTFLLKREGRRVHLVAFMDDRSRFLVGYGLHASASGAMVREVFLAAVARFGAPREVLTDNGTQYKTWRGVSQFTRMLEQRGIRHVVASPRRPQTLGKTERFWGTLWRELLEPAVFLGIDDARRRIGLFIDWYNFQRPHQGIGGMVPADRYFAAAPQVKATLLSRVATNAEALARHGAPRKPFYLTGRVGDAPFTLHAEGEKVVLMKGGEREEVDLSAPGPRREDAPGTELPEPVAVTAEVADLLGGEDDEERGEAPPAPGTSPLDGVLGELGAVAEERRAPRPETDGAVERPANDHGPATPAGGDA